MGRRFVRRGRPGQRIDRVRNERTAPPLFCHGRIQLPAQPPARLRPENGVVGVPLGGGRDLILIEIHQKIRLDQQLIVRSGHVGVSMVMAHQVADPGDVLRRPAQAGQQGLCLRRAQFFLVFPGAGAVSGFRRVDADVMDQGGGFQNGLGVWVQLFLLPQKAGKAWTLRK